MRPDLIGVEPRRGNGPCRRSLDSDRLRRLDRQALPFLNACQGTRRDARGDEMLFNSATFVFLFLPIVLFGLYLIGRLGGHRFAIVWLIVASAVFYGWFKVIYLPLLAILTAFNYLCGSKLSRECEAGRRRPVLLAVGIAVNLGVLAYFKYMNFFLDNFNGLFETHFRIGAVLLPLGISFFIFQKIAYLANLVQGGDKFLYATRIRVVRDVLPAADRWPDTFITSELIPQLRQRLRISPACFERRTLSVHRGTTEENRVG